MIRCVALECKKLFHIPYFLFAVIAITMLCMTATVDYDEMGKSLTLFSLMLSEESGAVIEHSALFLWKKGMGEWMIVVAPMLLTMSYITLISGERQNHQIRFQIMRTGNIRYCVSKIVSGALYGGLVFVIGYACLGGILSVRFPAFGSFSAEEQGIYLEMWGASGVVVLILKQFLGTFFFGIAESLFGIGVAIVFRDKYMLLCLPFLLNYLYRQTLQRILNHLTMTGKRVDAMDALYPEMVMEPWVGRYRWMIVLAVVLIYIGLIGVFYLSVKRRNGNGCC